MDILALLVGGVGCFFGVLSWWNLATKNEARFIAREEIEAWQRSERGEAYGRIAKARRAPLQMTRRSEFEN